MRIIYIAISLFLIFISTDSRSEPPVVDKIDHFPINVEFVDVYSCAQSTQFEITLDKDYEGEEFIDVFLGSKKSSSDNYFIKLGVDENYQTIVCIPDYQAEEIKIVATYGYDNCEGIQYAFEFDLKNNEYSGIIRGAQLKKNKLGEPNDFKKRRKEVKDNTIVRGWE